MNFGLLAIPAGLFLLCIVGDLLEMTQFGQCRNSPPWAVRMLPLQIGLVWTVWARLKNRAGLVPTRFLKLPLCWAIGAYALIVIFNTHGSYGLFEMGRRFWLALVPLYIFAFGTRKPTDLLWSLYAFVLVSIPVSWQAADVAVRSHFTQYITTTNSARPLLTVNHVLYSDVSATMVLICWVIFLTRRHLPWRIAAGIGVLFGFFALLASMCRGAIIGTVVAMIAVAFLSKVKMRFLLPGSVAIVAAIILGIFFLPDDIKADRLMGNNKYSTVDDRLKETSIQFRYIELHPLQPLGLGVPLITETKQVFNDYTYVLVQDYLQLGFFGALALLISGGMGIQMALKNASRVPINSSAATINLAAFGIFVLYCIHANLDAFWSQLGDHSVPFVALGMIIFIKLWLDAQVQKEMDDEMRS